MGILRSINVLLLFIYFVDRMLCIVLGLSVGVVMGDGWLFFSGIIVINVMLRIIIMFKDFY